MRSDTLIKVGTAYYTVLHMNIVPCGKLCDKRPAQRAAVCGAYLSAVIIVYVPFDLFKFVGHRCVAFAVVLVKACVGNGCNEESLG